MRHLHKDARPISGGFIASAGPPVSEVFQYLHAVPDDIVGFLTFDMADEADTAGVVLEPRIIESLVGILMV